MAIVQPEHDGAVELYRQRPVTRPTGRAPARRHVADVRPLPALVDVPPRARRRELGLVAVLSLVFVGLLLTTIAGLSTYVLTH